MEREGSGSAAVEGAHADLMRWRAAHPRATLTEIELAVEAAVQRLRARYLAEVVATAPVAEGPTAAPDPSPGCPHCGGAVRARGRRGRAVLTAGQPDPVALDRPYFVCTRCGAGVFPPG